MLKKLVCVLLVSLVLFTTCSALSETLTSTFTGPHFEHYYDGTWKSFTKDIGKATHKFTLDYIVPTPGSGTGMQYYGGIDQGTTLAKLGTATSATINTKPNFSATTSDQRKKITIKFSGGKWTIKYKDTQNVDKNGNRTQDSSVITKTSSFSASKTYS